MAVTESDYIINYNNQNCRICLESSQEKLKKRCNCTDPCHDSCLVKWLKIRSNNIQFNELKCEICKSKYKFDKHINKMLNKNQYKVGVILFQIICPFWTIYFFYWSITKDSTEDFLYVCTMISLIVLLYGLLVFFFLYKLNGL